MSKIPEFMRAFAEVTGFKLEPHPAAEVYAAEESVSIKTLKQISYILASEGANKNRDYWTKETLETYHKTIINEHLNINHARDDYDDSPIQIVGHNVASEMITLEDGRPAIKAYAVLYDYALRYNETYLNLLGLLESGALRASMEVLFTDFRLVNSRGEVITEEPPDMGDMLSFLVNKNLFRAFHGMVKFCGAAMLLGLPPADPKAVVEDEETCDEEAHANLIDREEEFSSIMDYSTIMQKLLDVEILEDKASVIAWLQNIKTTLAAEELKVLTYQNLPLDTESSWSEGEAKKRVWDWANEDVNKYSKAFILLRGDPENRESYAFRIGDIKEGKLVAVWSGVTAAMVAVHGARNKSNVPENVLKQLHNHLAEYYKKTDKEPPEF